MAKIQEICAACIKIYKLYYGTSVKFCRTSFKFTSKTNISAADNFFQSTFL